MFNESTYRKMYARILPEASLTERVLSAGRARPSRQIPRRALRRFILAAALVLSLGLALPALAVGSPSIYRLMYAVSPTIAQFFVPVEESCEADGLRMEVVSARVSGSEAAVYITLRDLTQDRVDGTIDLFDSYALNIPFDSTGSCEQVDYNGETKTATFLISISTMHGEPIPSGKVTFSIGCFLSGKQTLENMPVELDLKNLPADPDALLLEKTDGSADRVLKPGAVIATPVEGFDVTAVGYLDGRLHVQLHTPGRVEFDDHAFLTLTDAGGNKINGDLVYHYFDGGYTDVIDYVFPVSKDLLGGCSLTGDFTLSRSKTDCDLSVTFPLENA